MRRLASLSTVAFLAIASAGCGVEASAGPVEAMLDRVADTPANRHQVVVVDYARAREVLGIEQLPSDPSNAELAKLLQAYGQGSLEESRPDPVSVLAAGSEFLVQGNRVDEYRRAGTVATRERIGGPRPTSQRLK